MSLSRSRSGDGRKHSTPVESTIDRALTEWENEGGALADGGTRLTGEGSGTLQQAAMGLPNEPLDWLTSAFSRFVAIEAMAGVALLAATIVALVLSNTSWSAGYASFWEAEVGLHVGPLEYNRSLRHWLNDGLMTLFFFVVALELKRELVLGELRGWRVAALPFAAAIGGMLVPAAIYLALMVGSPGLHGWGSVVATDTAFVIGGLAILGARVPTILRVFLLSLAIFDDVGAILVVAVGYGEQISWVPLGAAALALGVVYGLARLGVRSIPIYFLAGAAVWVSLDSSGIHPTVAGVALGLMTPARGWVNDERLRALFGRVLAYPAGEHWSRDTVDRDHLREAGRAAREVVSPLEQLEARLHPWVGLAIMPAFALANAGVPLSTAGLTDPVAIAIIAGLFLGKPVGVISMSWLAVRSGIATRPQALTWPILFAGSVLTGIGFTMSLFIAGLAYSPAMLGPAKIGVLCGSLAAGVVGLSLLAWLTRPGRVFAVPPPIEVSDQAS